MPLRLICTDLSILKGPDTLVDGKKYRLGRAPECSFVVNDLSVSRIHAELIALDHGVLVKDLKSLNGTFVDGVPISEGKLLPGQTIFFGSAQFRLARLEEVGTDNGSFAEVSTHALKKNRGSLKSVTRPHPKLKHLSEAQRRVLDLLLTGRSEKAVANHLGNSAHTVHNHVKEIYRKMGVNSRPELLALFVSESKITEKPS